jgi:hypothetical protein
MPATPRNRPHPTSHGRTHVSMTDGDDGDGCGCASCNGGVARNTDNGVVFRPATGFTRNAIDRYLAVELEIATTASNADAIDTVVNQYRLVAKYDGSVGDGCEITTQPAMGDDFVDMIKALTDAFTTAHATVDQRCGFHVHVDARDISADGCRRLFLAWAHIEPILFQCMPPSRRTNQYCGPMKRQIEDANIGGPSDSNLRLSRQLAVAVSQRDYGNAVQIAPYSRCFTGDRYRALNATALASHGTIEFRLAAGTVNYRKVVAWATFVGNIVDRMFRGTEADLQAVLALDPWNALLSFAPTEDVADWLVERRQKFDETTDPATLVRFPTSTFQPSTICAGLNNTSATL